MTETRTGWGEARTRQLSWYEPLATAAFGRDVSGREFLQGIMEGRFPPPPIATLINAELVSVADGEVVFRATPDETVYNPIGLVHGGFLCTLLDSAAGCAVHSRLPAGVGYSSVEIKVSFLRPVRNGQSIEAVGRALRVGRRIAFAEAHARTVEGELVGHATTSLAVISPGST